MTMTPRRLTDRDGYERAVDPGELRVLPPSWVGEAAGRKL